MIRKIVVGRPGMKTPSQPRPTEATPMPAKAQRRGSRTQETGCAVDGAGAFHGGVGDCLAPGPRGATPRRNRPSACRGERAAPRAAGLA